MNDLSEFQQRAAATAVKKMLNGKHFSICDLDAIAETIGRKAAMAGPDYAALRAIHCVDWADMGPELAYMTREKCLELLGLTPMWMEMAEARKPEGKQMDKPKKLALAFWRSQ